jgi:hypothetical protein
MAPSARTDGAKAATDLANRLRVAWSRETSTSSDEWSDSNPALGQCAVTALIVQDTMGGQLLRSTVDGVSHYWNRLPSGEVIDLTFEQFGPDAEIDCLPELRSRDYVLSFPDTARRYGALRRRLRMLHS